MNYYPHNKLNNICKKLLISVGIDKEIAMKVRDFYSKTKNSESFVQPSENGNHRIFF